MTITNPTSSETKLGNGTATVFAFSFPITQASELNVIKIDSSGTETSLSEGAGASNYSVSVANYPGTGTITYPSSGGDRLESGEKLFIERIVTLTQDTDLQNQAAWKPEVIEQALDYLTMIGIQLNTLLEKSISLPKTSSLRNIFLPKTLAANSVIQVNSDGDGFVNGPSASEISTANTKAQEAATSATNAATSATAASTKASEASTSATNAATSATNASNSASAAATSATNADVAKIAWQGDWSSSATYNVSDAVHAAGNAYICNTQHSNQQPPNSSYWDLLVSRGTDGIGSGTVTSIIAGTGLSGGTITDSGTIDLDNVTISNGGTGATTSLQAAINLGLKNASGLLIGNGSQLTGINSIPVGVILPYSFNSPPTGFLKCNGAVISRTTYASLFSTIGTTWGSGDGSTTFALPDLRGEFLRGWDDGRGIDASRGFASSQEQYYYDRTTGDVVGANTATETRPRNIAVLYVIKY